MAQHIDDVGESLLGGRHAGGRHSPGEVPATEAGQVAQLSRVAEATTGASGSAQQVEVVGHTPARAGRQADEHPRPRHVVVTARHRLAHVVEQRRGEQLAIGVVAARVAVDLQGVEECVAFGVVARVLLDAIEGLEQRKELVVERACRVLHGRGRAGAARRHGASGETRALTLAVG